MRLPASLIPIVVLLLASLRPSAAAAPRGLAVDVSSAAGVRWEFQPEGSDTWKPITVPGGGWRAQGYTCDAGIYRTTLSIPESARDRVVRLAFAAVNFGADVFAGPDEDHLKLVASHVNGWMPFSADLTPYAHPGAKVAVRVEVKGRRKFMHNGRYTVPEGATWFTGLAEGILRGVSLEMISPVRIEDVWVHTRRTPDTLEAQATLANDTDRPVTVRLIPRLATAGPARFRYPVMAPIRAELPAHGHADVNLGKAAWNLGSSSYWWPNLPYRAGYRAQLHRLELVLEVDGKTVDTFGRRFGFRQFSVVGNHYELNGIRVNLRGDNQQEADFGTDAYGTKAGFGPPSASNPGWPKAVDNLLRLNFTILRIHQIPATPYMLDVCDERGLMLVGESPLRGSEGGEDYAAGRENMLAMDREMVLRDRSHPAIVIWSAANEWTAPIPDAVKVIRAEDDTRPIIADGVGDMGAPYINMEHYVNGLGGLPTAGGSARADRPYGETEAVWPMDNTWQGFAWMATSVRLRRLKGNADLRNYVLNNAWPDYVPGEGPETEVLEKKVKSMGGDMQIHAALGPDPWRDPHVRLMQQCYHPLAACDVDFDLLNARSNVRGDWPTVKPRLSAGSHVSRTIAVFNDELRGQQLALRWQLRQGGKAGRLLAEGRRDLSIPLGAFRIVNIAFDAPKTPGDAALLLRVDKDGHERFREEAMVFAVVAGSAAQVPDGVYRLVSVNSGLPAVMSGSTALQAGANEAQVWRVKNLGNDEVAMISGDGRALSVGRANENGAPVVLEPLDGGASQVWRLGPVGADSYTLMNKRTGKALDVFRRATTPGAQVVQWDPNDGANQQWRLERAGR